MTQDRLTFLANLHPYDALPHDALQDIVDHIEWVELGAGEEVSVCGEPLKGLYIVWDGQVSVRDQNDTPISVLHQKNTFGERGLLRNQALGFVYQFHHLGFESLSKL